MARLPDLLKFAAEHDLKVGTIADLINYRSQTENLVTRAAERKIETPYGVFDLIAYDDVTTNETHLALVKGVVNPDKSLLVRVHEPLTMIDLLDCNSKNHSWSLHDAMQMISQEGSGVVVMLRRAEKKQDLIHAIQAAEQTPHTPAILKDYGIGAQILKDLGVVKMRLMGGQRKIPSITGFGLEVTAFLQSPTEMLMGVTQDKVSKFGTF
jgi:3,4-dihydroxy 2-butanone 4-phosphate synthase / GTP cyclohydrolase II